jgi:FixJ family two-component response regulator
VLAPRTVVIPAGATLECVAAIYNSQPLLPGMKVLSSQLPVIILTGDVRVTVLHDIAKHGYVSRQKPLVAAELLEEVQRLLGENSGLYV